MTIDTTSETYQKAYDSACFLIQDLHELSKECINNDTIKMLKDATNIKNTLLKMQGQG